MYKILLASDRPEVLSAFNGIESWENMGFRAPRVCNSAESAIACLKAHHVDGIAIALSKAEDDLLMGHLAAFYPILPIFTVGDAQSVIIGGVTELRSLLNRTHADFSNDGFGEADMLQLCRHEFFRALLSGKISKRQDVENRLRLLRSRMDPEKACVIVDLTLPKGEEYLSGRWHYGSERLEIALRNFFGAEFRGMRMLVAVLAPDHIRLLCCPMLGVAEEENGESLTGLVAEKTEEAMAQVREYLDLELQIVNISVLPNVTALAKE